MKSRVFITGDTHGEIELGAHAAVLVALRGAAAPGAELHALDGVDAALSGDGDGRHAVFGVGHGHTAVRKAADKVHRAVDRVDDKQLRGVERLLLVHLLAEEVRLRQRGAQIPDHKLLHRAVILGHDVPRAALVFGHHALCVQDKLAGLALGLLHGKTDLLDRHRVSPSFFSSMDPV